MTMLSKKLNHRGFTLIELLIVVAIIGLISAIAIPGLFDAIQKARQKRSMGDLKTLSTAIEIYAVDNDFYPRIGPTIAFDLKTHLSGVMQITPALDGFGFPFQYSTDAVGDMYTLVSFGSNRIEDLPYTYGHTRRFSDDLVFNTGIFLQWPEGVQK